MERIDSREGGVLPALLNNWLCLFLHVMCCLLIGLKVMHDLLGLSLDNRH
jgi:hypothetical protein